jgi:hypothetical protein
MNCSQGVFVRRAVFAILVLVMQSGCSDGRTPIPTTFAEKRALAAKIVTLQNGMAARIGFDPVAQAENAAQKSFASWCDAMPAEKLKTCLSNQADLRPMWEQVLAETMDELKQAKPSLDLVMVDAVAKTYSGAELASLADLLSRPEFDLVNEREAALITNFLPTALSIMQPIMDRTKRRIDELGVAKFGPAWLDPPASAPN